MESAVTGVQWSRAPGLGYVVLLGGRERNDVSSAQATGCPGLHCSLQSPTMAARIAPGPLGVGQA